MFFLLLKSFFVAGSFLFCSRDIFSFRFIYCLPCKSWFFFFIFLRAFDFYWFGLECILVVLFWCVSSLWHLFVSFLKLEYFFSHYIVFPIYFWIPWNSSLDSWFGLYGLFFFYMGCIKVFISVIRSTSFKCLQKNIKLVSYNYRIVITYIIIDKWGPVLIDDFFYFCIVTETILLSEETSSNQE